MTAVESRKPTAESVLLDVRQLTMHFTDTEGLFRRRARVIRAVDGVSFTVRRGRTLGLVGESGCGKSTTGRAILQLYRPTAGEVLFENQDLCKLGGERLRQMRRRMQMIFQDPYSSLNPRRSVRDILSDPLEIHHLATTQKARDARVAELLELVGLNPAFAERYPHEFSGGQRQRIGIARALAVEPEFLVCDEPVSALDVSIQAQIINLLKSLQARLGLTYLFIAHDLSVVRHISDDIAVMYLGKIVEMAPRTPLYEQPLHPYTRAILSAVPVPNPRIEARRQRIILTGDLPSPLSPPTGCRFHTRCPWAKPRCGEAEPVVVEAQPGHFVACHYWQEIQGTAPPSGISAAAPSQA
ncbi:MAG: ABC transporter ATP-binding protein [Candidatus Limnocylindrales bacterium]